MQNLSIFGVGGHSKVVIDTAILSGFSNFELYDDNPSTHDTLHNCFRVQGGIPNSLHGVAVIAIGNNYIRQKISTRVKDVKWQTLIHPGAIVAKDVEIGEGSLIFAGAIVQPGVKIGRHCIINTGACIDHDSVIEDFVHIAPNCALAGGVRVGEGTLVGIGTSVILNTTIGKWTMIGAGAVVIHNQPDFCTSVGSPARPIKFHNEAQ